MDGNLISCLENLFDVEALFIYEDMLEIHELVEIETKLKNRANPLNYSIDVIDEKFRETSSKREFNETVWTYYHESLAFLSERNRFFYSDVIQWYDLRLEEAWVLGANSVDIPRIHSNQRLKCDEYTCYQKSLIEGKICKQGKFFVLSNAFK